MSHFLEGKSVCLNVISLSEGGSSGTEHTCLKKTFLRRVLYLSLHFPCFTCSAFYPGWVSVEGPNVVLYFMKVLINPQWTQFFRMVLCPTRSLSCVHGMKPLEMHLFAFSVLCTPRILFMHIQGFKKATRHKPFLSVCIRKASES